MEISESRTRELLQWLDDQAGDHTHLFEQMTCYRDAAALIRQLQDEVREAAREQERDKDRAQQPLAEPQPVGVEDWLIGDLMEAEEGGHTAHTPAELCGLAAKAIKSLTAQQPAAVDEAMVERALAAYLRRQDDGESLYGCVTAALSAALATQPAAVDAKDAEIEELREALDWTVQQNDELMNEGRELTARAERLAEALREMREYITAALQDQREAFSGHEDSSDIPGIEADLHKIDTLLRELEEGK